MGKAQKPSQKKPLKKGTKTPDPVPVRSQKLLQDKMDRIQKIPVRITRIPAKRIPTNKIPTNRIQDRNAMTSAPRERIRIQILKIRGGKKITATNTADTTRRATATIKKAAILTKT